MGDPAARAAVREPAVAAREAELARVDAFVAAVPEGSRALLIRGEPGIWKTTLWRHGVGCCRAAGLEVLADPQLAVDPRLESAAAYQRRARTDVRFLGSAGVPGDESFLSLFAAPSLEAVAGTVERARVQADRIVPIFWRAGSQRPLGVY